MGFVSKLLFWHQGTYMGGGQWKLYLLETDASLVTMPETLFFLPKCHEQLLTEKGIAWNHLLPSYLEGNFIPWFDLAVLSPMLITLNSDGVVIYLYCSCADPTACTNSLCCQSLAILKTRRVSAAFSQQSSTIPRGDYGSESWDSPTSDLFELFPHGLLCWQVHGGRAQVGQEGWVSHQGSPRCWELLLHPRDKVSAGTITHISLFACWVCSC